MRSALMRYRRPMAMVVAVVILGVAGAEYVRHVNWHGTLAVIRHASLLIVGIATAFHLMSLLSKAGVWFVCLRALGAGTYRIVVRATFVGAALNSLFMGSVGEVGRVVIMTRATGLRTYAVLTTVALERLLNMGGFVAVLCVALLITPLRVAAAPTALVAAILVVSAAWLATRTSGSRRRSAVVGRAGSGARRFRRLWRIRARRIAKIARRVITPRRLAMAVPLTLLDWTCQLASYHLVARAAHLPMGITGSLVALLAVNVGLVVRVTPGNVGVFEIAYATAAHSLGAPMDAALGVGMLIHLAQDLPTIVLGTLGRPLVFARDRATARTPGRRSVVRPAIQSPTPGGTSP